MTAQLRTQNRFYWRCEECDVSSASSWEAPSGANQAAAAHNRIAHAETMEDAHEVPC